MFENFNSIAHKAFNIGNTIANKIAGGARYLADKVPSARQFISFANTAVDKIDELANTTIGKTVLNAIPYGNTVKNGIDTARSMLNSGSEIVDTIGGLSNAIANKDMGSALNIARDAFGKLERKRK